ncbi:MAG TPA: segregation/condensation protein A [Armatimonadota bacterium]|nr:segregation/condensation protein A [Armatimonadota bacterium]
MASSGIGAGFEQFTGHPVKIEIFEGPLDLLIHLVRREEVEASEVSIVRITEQFLGYLRTMRQISIDVAVDFVVMAATLLLLKSRSLLPREEEPEEDEEALEDPAVELARRLAEYRTFKEAAEILHSAQQARKQIYLRPLAEDDALGAGVVPLEDVSVFDMVAAMQEILARARELPPHTIQRERISIAERIEQIAEQLRAAGVERTWFDELCPLGSSRVFIVVTFLAVLELIRRRQLRVRQEQPRGRIEVYLSETEEPDPADVSRPPSKEGTRG